MLSKKLAKLTTISFPLEATVSQLSTNNSSCTNSYRPLYADALKQVGNSANSSTSNIHEQTRAPRANVKRNSTVNKNFNTVIYGLSECVKGSLASKTIKSICPDLSDYAICDCTRMGKYSEHRTRLLIVKFARFCDVTAVLSDTKYQKLNALVFL